MKYLSAKCSLCDAPASAMNTGFGLNWEHSHQVIWCERGHVVVKDPAHHVHRLVYDFDKGE